MRVFDAKREAYGALLRDQFRKRSQIDLVLQFLERNAPGAMPEIPKTTPEELADASASVELLASEAVHDALLRVGEAWHKRDVTIHIPPAGDPNRQKQIDAALGLFKQKKDDVYGPIDGLRQAIRDDLSSG
jgi:hypothetical protein